MALSNARLKAALDAGLSTTTHIGFSENGTTETAWVPRTSGTFAAASTADPSVAYLSENFTSELATSGCTLTHRAGFDASTAGNQTTTWVQLLTPVPLVAGGHATMVSSGCAEKLNADDTYV